MTHSIRLTILCGAIFVSGYQAFAQKISVEVIALEGGLLAMGSPAVVTTSQTVLVQEASRLRFIVLGLGSVFAIKSVEFTIVQAGRQIAEYGPPGRPLDRKARTRVVPDCRPVTPRGLDCATLPMATVSTSGGPVTVSASATDSRGNRRSISVVYAAINASNPGDTNSTLLSAATGSCNPSPGGISLLPSYYFDNRSLKLKTARFYFSATYIGSNPGDPPCAAPPGNVSGVVGPFDILYGASEEAEIPGYTYIGNILPIGRWHLVAFSPEVGVTVTCDRTFGNDGIVLMKTKYPDSVINGIPGLCY